uniref:Amidohydrolase family protein n=1 Tax=Ganoderma boninense TaxID=34458 RepID=A0A5K1JUC5_9APHY|nr:Amidohydrolase family protein [Ganoderma boninense]
MSSVLPSPIGQRCGMVNGGAFYLSSGLFGLETKTVAVPYDAGSILAKCRSLHIKPGPAVDFHSRSQSDRYQSGTEAVLIRNATIWTGERNGKEVLHGDLFLDGGLIKAIGNVPGEVLAARDDVLVVEADGAWLTPGFVHVEAMVCQG